MTVHVFPSSDGNMKALSEYLVVSLQILCFKCWMF